MEELIENPILNFGDIIAIASAETQKKYLGSRLSIPDFIYFIEIPKGRSSIYQEYQTDLSFCVYPKLNYDHYKELAKASKNMQFFNNTNLEVKKDAEINDNREIIASKFDCAVEYGDGIQLFHVGSQSFLKGSKKKFSDQYGFTKLKLSKYGGRSSIFKVLSADNSKKDGQQVQYGDSIILLNEKLNFYISNCGPFITKDLPARIRESYDYSQLEDLNTTMKLSLAGVKETSITLKFKNVISRSRREQNTVCWGDFVKILNTSGGVLFSRGYHSTRHSELFLIKFTEEGAEKTRKYVQGIFQIVPPDDEDFGKPIPVSESKFTKKPMVNLLLKHLLTGRYLEYNFKDEHFILHEKNLSLQPSRNLNRAASLKIFGDTHNQTNGTLGPNQILLHIPEELELKKTSSKKSLSQSREIVAEGIIIEFDEEKPKHLLFNTKFCIKRQTFATHAVFLSIGAPTDEKIDEEIYEMSTSDQPLFFYFSPVMNAKVVELMKLEYKIYPLRKLNDLIISPDIDSKFISEGISHAERGLKDLSSWLKNSSNDLTGEEFSETTKYMFLRDIGIFDSLLNFIFDLYDSGYMKEDSGTWKILLIRIILFLKEATTTSTLNARYLAKWKKYLIRVTINETNETGLRWKELVDSILDNSPDFVVSTTMIDPASIDELNSSALAIAIKTHKFSEEKSLFYRLQMLENLMVVKGLRYMIKKIEKNSEGFYEVTLKTNEKVVLQNSNSKSNTQANFELFVSYIGFIAEIAKNSPEVAKNQMSSIFPRSVCLEIACDNNIDVTLSTCFLKFFSQIYLASDSATILDQQLPDLLRYSSVTIPAEDLNQKKDELKNKVLNNEENKKFDYVKFMTSYLEKPIELKDSNCEYSIAVLEIIHHLCRKNLLDKELLERLGLLIFDFMQKSIKMSGQSFRTPSSQVMKWIEHSLRVLEIINKQRFNHVLTSLFEDPDAVEFFNDKFYSYDEDIFTRQKPSDYQIKNIMRNKKNLLSKYKQTYFPLTNPENLQFLLTFLTLNNPTLFEKVFLFISKHFHDVRDFYSTINQMELIHEKNQGYYDDYSKKCQALVEILHEFRSNSLETPLLEKFSELFKQVDKILTKLINTFFIREDISPDFIIENTPKRAYRGKSSSVSSAPKKMTGAMLEERFYRIYEDFKFDIIASAEKQHILRNLGFLDILSPIISALLEINKNKPNDSYLSIIENFLGFLIFFCVNNQLNQVLLLNHSDIISNLVRTDIPSLRSFMLRLFTEILRNNYFYLVGPSGRKISDMIIDRLLELINASWKENIQAISDYIRTFPIFVRTKEVFIQKNQMYISQRLYQSLHTSPIIKQILTNDLHKFLSNNKIENFSKDQPIQISPEVSFTISFLNNIAKLCVGPVFSLTESCRLAKNYLSFSELKELYFLAGEWYNLKHALISYLNLVYLRDPELSKKDFQDISEFISGAPLKELSNYVEYFNNNIQSNRKFVECVKFKYQIENEIVYNEHFEDVYHQYVVYGLLDTYVIFGSCLAQSSNKKGYSILELYLKNHLAKICEFWGKEVPEEKLNFEDVDDRKKRSQIKKVINHLTNLARSNKKADKLRLSKVYFLPKDRIKDLLEFPKEIIEEETDNSNDAMVKVFINILQTDKPTFEAILSNFQSYLFEDRNPTIKSFVLKILRNLGNMPDIRQIPTNTNIMQTYYESFIKTENINERLEFIDPITELLAEEKMIFVKLLLADKKLRYLKAYMEVFTIKMEEYLEYQRNYDYYEEPEASKIFIDSLNKNVKGLTGLFGLLTKLCSGKFELMQKYLVFQSLDDKSAEKPVNFLRMTIDFMGKIVPNFSDPCNALLTTIFEFIIQILCGPCQINQMFVSSTDCYDIIANIRKEYHSKSDLNLARKFAEHFTHLEELVPKKVGSKVLSSLSYKNDKKSCCCNIF